MKTEKMLQKEFRGLLAGHLRLFKLLHPHSYTEKHIWAFVKSMFIHGKGMRDRSWGECAWYAKELRGHLRAKYYDQNNTTEDYSGIDVSLGNPTYIQN